jgi:hypothetical protein
MHDGFDITFHEVIPELGLVELVVAELGKLSQRDGLHCSVVVSHGSATPHSFDVQVELLSCGRRIGLTGYAVDHDAYYAMRQAFSALRDACAADASAVHRVVTQR